VTPTAPTASHPTQPYPNDTLRWVAAEVRYPRFNDFVGGFASAFHDQMREHFPVYEEQTQMSVSVGPTGPSAQQLLQHRFITRDRLMSVTMGRELFMLETTDYQGWATFRLLLIEALRALEQAQRPDGIVRVGLRYIDEIRLPDPPEDFAAWTGWVDERLVAPFTLDDQAQPAGGTVVLQYGEPPGYVTLFRAAPLAGGRTVQEEGPLRMPFSTADGPYFLFDTDASWEDPERQVPEFAPDRIAETLDELHRTSKRLFEASITDRLRAEVLSRPREEVFGT
jgi:uncharacterized protein (TIGR04255 family)